MVIRVIPEIGMDGGAIVLAIALCIRTAAYDLFVVLVTVPGTADLLLAWRHCFRISCDQAPGTRGKVRV